MTDTVILERTTDAAAQHASARADDAAMLKAAASLTRDLNAPDARIYWADMLGSAVLGRDLRKEGRTLERLGLASASREELKTLLTQGR